MRVLAAVATALLLAAGAAGAREEIVAGVSRNSISITADFTGSELLIYGAIKRDAPLPDAPPIAVIITVEGPSAPATVRHKSRELGIWINTASVPISSAPTFYAVASSGPLDSILSQTDDLRYRISVEQMIRAVGAASKVPNVEDFVQALIRIRERDGAYGIFPDTVRIDDQTLFSSTIHLPANLAEGDYTTRMFILRDGAVIDHQETVIKVHKVGLERWLYILANQQPALYAVLSLVIAAFAGWAASEAFRIARR